METHPVFLIPDPDILGLTASTQSDQKPASAVSSSEAFSRDCMEDNEAAIGQVMLNKCVPLQALVKCQ